MVGALGQGKAQAREQGAGRGQVFNDEADMVQEDGRACLGWILHTK